MSNLVPDDSILQTSKNNIIIVSLPRTGTKSLSRCLQILGYSTKHCPSDVLSVYLQREAFDVYADTPVYCHSIFSQLCLEPSNKFIYIDREIESWLDSFQRTNLHGAYMDYLSRDYIRHATARLDKQCLLEVFQGVAWCRQMAIQAYENHKQTVLNTIPHSHLLCYRFEDGWESLCEFLNKPVPTEAIPHLNKGTLYDPV